MTGPRQDDFHLNPSRSRVVQMDSSAVQNDLNLINQAMTASPS